MKGPKPPAIVLDEEQAHALGALQVRDLNNFSFHEYTRLSIRNATNYYTWCNFFVKNNCSTHYVNRSFRSRKQIIKFMLDINPLTKLAPPFSIIIHNSSMCWHTIYSSITTVRVSASKN